MVEKYKVEMNKALTRLVEMEGENTVLKAKLASAQKRNTELEREVGGLRRQQQQQQHHHHHQQQATASEVGVAAIATAVPGVAPVTKEERERLLTYVQTIVDAGDENLSRQLMDKIKSHYPSFGAGGDYSINVYGYDDVTIRALLAFCEPLFETEEEGEEQQQQQQQQQQEEVQQQQVQQQENGHALQQEVEDKQQQQQQQKRDRPAEVVAEV
eukprot:evm.model.NODE_7059_length_31966_cov_21.646906.7